MEMEKDRKEDITRWDQNPVPLDHVVCTLQLRYSHCQAKSENKREREKTQLDSNSRSLDQEPCTLPPGYNHSHLITMNTHFIIAAAVLPKFVSRSLLHSGLYSSFINDRKCFNVKEPVSLMQFLIINQGSVKFR